jgi:serine/threonine protein kinase
MECFRLLPPHPNIVRLIDSNVNQKNKEVLDFYILMEFCSRGDLVDVMKARSVARTAASAARDSGSSSLMGDHLALSAALYPRIAASGVALEGRSFDEKEDVQRDVQYISDVGPTQTTDGCSDSYQQQRSKSQTLFSESELLRLISDVTKAVAHLHTSSPSFCHLDLCLENVLLSDDGRFKLCDFGACSNIRSLSEPGWCPPMPARMGYCSPEHILRFRGHASSFLFGNAMPVVMDGNGMVSSTQYATMPEGEGDTDDDSYAAHFPLTENMDIWALGSLLHKLAFSRLPFEDEFRPASYRSLFELFSKAHAVLVSEAKEMGDKKYRHRTSTLPLQVSPPQSSLVEMNDNQLYSREFHDLIQSMLQLYPKCRPSAGMIVQKVTQLPCWLPHLTPTENKVQSKHHRRASGLTISSSNLQSLQNHYGHNRRLSARSVKHWVHGKIYKGEAEKQRWLVKATSSQIRGPPKPKYVCRIVLDIWENPSLFSTYVQQV